MVRDSQQQERNNQNETKTHPRSRKEFGISWNKTLDEGGVLLGEEVKIALSLELNKKK